MGDMRGPEQAYGMIDAVQPVVHKVFKDQEQDPVQERILNGGRDPVVIKKGKDHPDIKRAQQQIEPHVQEHEVNILDRVFYSVGGLFAEVAEYKFKPDYDKVKRRGNQYQQLFPGSSHASQK